MPLACDRLGARQVFFDRATGVHAGSLRALVSRVPHARTSGLDPLGVAAAWGESDAPSHTCLRAVGVVAPCPTLGASPSPPGSRALAELLVSATSRALTVSHRPVVALGGGLDAALAVLAARRAGLTLTDAIHLAVPGTSYDESELARASAAALGLTLHEVRVTASELALALPRAVGLAGTPLYNLHPVSRVIVARAALARGYDTLVTGDGADQAARGAHGRADYVPIVAAITQGSGLVLASPFLDEALVDLLIATQDPAKEELRRLALAWGLPRPIAERPKVPCWAPPLPRARFPGEGTVARLSRALSRPLAWSASDRTNVGVASLASFVMGFEITLQGPPLHGASGVVA